MSLADAVSNVMGSGPAIPVPPKGGEDGIKIDRSGTDGIRVDRSGKAGGTGGAKRALKECWFDLAPVYRCGGVSVGDSECDCTSDCKRDPLDISSKTQLRCKQHVLLGASSRDKPSAICLSSGVKSDVVRLRSADNVADELDLFLGSRSPICLL